MIDVISWFWENGPMVCIKFLFVAVLFTWGAIDRFIDTIRQERRKREIEKYREFWRNY